ncbi:hypothetical protein Alsa2_CDS0170 [Staphylococcus phage Alsa_2]|nr:hypothetical protein Alsa2_CDS0170 [Staphylococcus phage Alsa_2]
MAQLVNSIISYLLVWVANCYIIVSKINTKR